MVVGVGVVSKRLLEILRSGLPRRERSLATAMDSCLSSVNASLHFLFGLCSLRLFSIGNDVHVFLNGWRRFEFAALRESKDFCGN